MALLKICLVRHGITEWNIHQRIQGHTDVPLNKEGRLQAGWIADRLELEAPAAIWSSDLCRAAHTAETIAAPHKLPVNYSPALREVMMGDWEGLTRAEIAALGQEEAFEQYRRDPYRFRPPASEPLDEVWRRVIGVLDEIRTERPCGTVVIVGHGGSMRALLCNAMNAPASAMRHFSLDNASLSIVEEREAGDCRLSRLLLVNDTSHIPRSGPAGRK